MYDHWKPHQGYPQNMIDKNRCSRSKPSFYQQVYPISDVSEKLISVSHKPFELLVGPGEVNYF